jgi:potassium-transporting ATPase KdpC subunit
MRTCIVTFVFLSVLCGGVYPVAVTGFAQLVCPARANGNLVMRDGRAVGSQSIGQLFDQPGYLWGRPSATRTPYTPCAPDLSSGSAGSNLGPLDPALQSVVAARIEALRAGDAAADRSRPQPINAVPVKPVPIDLVTASGSGLDPHVSLAAAEYQVERIARARAVDAQRVREVLASATQGRQFGILGEPVVHVLSANLALDRAFGVSPR